MHTRCLWYGQAMSSKRRRRLVFIAAIAILPVALWALARIVGPADSQADQSSPSPAVTGAISPSASPNVFVSQDACVTLPPSNGKIRGIVFLDAGHGGVDPGTRGRTSGGVLVHEKDVALA